MLSQGQVDLPKSANTATSYVICQTMKLRDDTNTLLLKFTTLI